MLAVLLSAAGCSRPAGVPGDETGGQSAQRPPFPDQDNGRSGSDDPTATRDSDATPRQNADSPDTQSLPAGTLLTVRLNQALASSAANGSFEALVDEAVVMEGDAKIPRGAVVEGRVESVRTSDVKPDRGLVQLTLETVRLEGVDVPVKTASLFGRQTSPKDAATSTVLLEKGRRLTFRFTEPVSIPTHGTQAGR